MNGSLTVIMPMNFLYMVLKGRRALKVPAVPSEPSQVPPPWCAHCSCSFNKPITSKLLFWLQIILQREQQPRRGEGDPSALSLAWAAATGRDAHGTLGAWAGEPLSCTAEKKPEFEATDTLGSNLHQIVPCVPLGSKLWQCHCPGEPAEPRTTSQVCSWHLALQRAVAQGPRGRPHTRRYSSTEVSRCLTLVSGVIGTNRRQRLLRKLPCRALSSCFLGNLITAWAGKEPGGTVKRDSLHLAY